MKSTHNYGRNVGQILFQMIFLTSPISKIKIVNTYDLIWGFKTMATIPIMHCFPPSSPEETVIVATSEL